MTPADRKPAERTLKEILADCSDEDALDFCTRLVRRAAEVARRAELDEHVWRGAIARAILRDAGLEER